MLARSPVLVFDRNIFSPVKRVPEDNKYVATVLLRLHELQKMGYILAVTSSRGKFPGGLHVGLPDESPDESPGELEAVQAIAKIEGLPISFDDLQIKVYDGTLGQHDTVVVVREQTQAQPGYPSKAADTLARVRYSRARALRVMEFSATEEYSSVKLLTTLREIGPALFETESKGESKAAQAKTAPLAAIPSLPSSVSSASSPSLLTSQHSPSSLSSPDSDEEEELEEEVDFQLPKLELLSGLKEQLKSPLAQYASCWKLSWFGHHHNARANFLLDYIDRVRTLQDLESLRDLLQNQKDLFDYPSQLPSIEFKGDDPSEVYWTESLTNKRKGGFYKAITTCLEIANQELRVFESVSAKKPILR